MDSPPLIKVPEDAVILFTVMNLFFIAFFKADFVEAAIKTPTPYSCSRIGASKAGTICISVELISLDI